MTAVIGIVNYEGMILIGKKRSDSVKKLSGKWHIPGGHVENGENDKQALIREILEEAGIEIKVGKYIGLSITPTSRSEARWYECFADTNRVYCASDLEDIKWIEKNKVLEVCSEKAVSLWPEEIKDYFSS